MTLDPSMMQQMPQQPDMGMGLMLPPPPPTSDISLAPQPEPVAPTAELRLSAEKRKYLADWVCESIRAARQDAGRMFFLQRLAQWNRAYRGIAAPKNFPWPNAANVFVPMTAWTVDSMADRIARATLYTDPIVLVHPLDPTNHEHVEKAKAQETWLQHVLVHVLNFRTTGRDLSHLVCREGTAVTQLSWRDRTTRKRGTKYQDGKLLLVEEEKRFIGPELEFASLEDFELVPAYARTIGEAVGALRRLYLRKPVLEYGQKCGYYQDVDKVKTPFQADYGTSPVRVTEEQAEGIESTYRARDEDREFQVYEGRWLWDVNGDGIEEKLLVTVALDDGVLLRAEHYPYLHGEDYFLPWRAIRLPNRFYGQSYPDKISNLQEETNAIHNQRLDALSICIAPVLKARRGAVIGEGSSRDIRFYPGAFLWLDDLSDVQPLDMPPINPSAIQEESVLQNYLEQLTGISKMRMGQSNTGRRPLGETELFMQEGNVRLDERVSTFGDSLPDLCYQIVQLYRQYHGQFPEMGEMSFLDVPVVYIPNGNLASTNMQFRKQQKMQFAAFMRMDQRFAMDAQRQHNLEKWVASDFDLRDADGILGQEPAAGTPMPLPPGGGGGGSQPQSPPVPGMGGG